MKDESDIKNFSTRQLKVLLDDNCVDYRGCIEKDELVQRAMMLWHSKRQQQNSQYTFDFLTLLREF